MFAQLRTAILLTAIVSMVMLTSTAYPATNYAVTDTLPLAGPTRWDYLTFDSPNHRLFITRGNQVDVLDVDTHEITGSIPASGAHGVALAPELGRGFISNGTANTVTVFDLTNLDILATMPTGNKQDAIIYDAATKQAFAANGDSGNITVIDANDNAVTKTIELTGKPEFMAVDGAGQLYVNIEDKSQLTTIDTKALKVTANYNLAPQCDSPTGLAIDANQLRLFTVCSNKMMVVVNALNGKIVSFLPIGASSDSATFDPITKRAFSSNGEGTITVVDAADPTHYQVLQTVPTIPTARTMALNPETHQLYLAAAETDGADAPTAQQLHPRPHIKPDTFKILTVEEK